MTLTNNPQPKPRYLSQGQSKTNKRILPPYAKSVPINQSFIVVCTGSGCWWRAKSTGWLSGINKTLLPHGDNPEIYKWSFVCNKDVLIFSHGVLETYDCLVELSRCLLRYGAAVVLWCIPQYPMNKFSTGASHAAR